MSKLLTWNPIQCLSALVSLCAALGPVNFSKAPRKRFGPQNHFLYLKTERCKSLKLFVWRESMRKKEILAFSENVTCLHQVEGVQYNRYNPTTELMKVEKGFTGLWRWISIKRFQLTSVYGLFSGVGYRKRALLNIFGLKIFKSCSQHQVIWFKR